MKKNERATRFIVTALVLGMTASAASCLRVNDEHCMFHGGNTACNTDRYCVAAVNGGVSALASVDAEGCWDQEPSMEEFSTGSNIAYVKYGLVKDEVELDALRRRLGVAADCAYWPSLTPLLEGIEPDLRSREKASRKAAALNSAQGDAINLLVSDIEAALALCDVDPTTGSTTMVEETTTMAGTETNGESGTTGDVVCMSDADCSGDTPFCSPEGPDMGRCVTCDGMPEPHAACAGMNAETPVCHEGVCVQCTVAMPEECTGVPPLCDAAANVCLPCTAHEQCGEAACNLFTGACLPEGEDYVVHVGPGQTHATLAAAVAAIEGPEGTLVVHAGPPSYDESVTVDDGQVIAFLAAELGPGIDPPLWIRSGVNAPQLTVNAGGTVLLDGMQLSNNASTATPGLLILGQAWLDRSRVVNNDGGGISVQTEGNLVLRNCFVGGDVSDRNALAVNESTASVLYSTLGAGFGTSTALTCSAGSTVTVRNSLVVSRSDAAELACIGAAVEHSSAEMPLGAPRDMNTDLPNMNQNWFVSWSAGDFHLTNNAPPAIDTAARWHLGDPPTDIDGDLRPTADDTSDVVGADSP